MKLAAVAWLALVSKVRSSETIHAGGGHDVMGKDDPAPAAANPQSKKHLPARWSESVPSITAVEDDVELGVTLEKRHTIGTSEPSIRPADPQMAFWNQHWTGYYGIWGDWEFCPEGEFAIGVQTKSMAHAPLWDDDVALNGIKLVCTSGMHITSLEGSDKFGSWGFTKRCPDGRYMTKYKIQRVDFLGLNLGNLVSDNDDIGMNNIMFHCDDGSVHKAAINSPDNWGRWYPWETCPAGHGICGFRTRVLPAWDHQDDLGMTNMQVRCCDAKPKGKAVVKWQYACSTSHGTSCTSESSWSVHSNISSSWSRAHATNIQAGFESETRFGKFNVNLGTSVTNTLGNLVAQGRNLSGKCSSTINPSAPKPTFGHTVTVWQFVGQMDEFRNGTRGTMRIASCIFFTTSGWQEPKCLPGCCADQDCQVCFVGGRCGNTNAGAQMVSKYTTVYTRNGAYFLDKRTGKKYNMDMTPYREPSYTDRYTHTQRLGTATPARSRVTTAYTPVYTRNGAYFLDERTGKKYNPDMTPYRG